MNLTERLAHWIESLFKAESDRLSQAQEMLIKAGLTEGHARKMMDVLVPLSHIHGFDVPSLCYVIAHGKTKSYFIEMEEFKQMLAMNFPAILIMTDVYFIEAETVWKFVGEGTVSWTYFCAAVVLYYDNLQKN